MLHISIAAEPLFNILGLEVTNSLLTTILIVVVLVVVAFVIRRTLREHNPSRPQMMLETVIGTAYDFVKGITPSNAMEFFPLVMALLIFIVASNWFGLIPGITGIGLEHVVEEHGEKQTLFTHLFRPGTADLNTTIALSLISVVAIQYYGIKHLGLRYFKKYINFSSPINFFVGFLEVVSEIGKIISFAFRLFGNVFAGEVLLAVMGMLIPIIVPIPFYLLEVFVGFIQGFVFFMLTLVFIQLATAEQHS